MRIAFHSRAASLPYAEWGAASLRGRVWRGKRSPGGDGRDAPSGELPPPAGRAGPVPGPFGTAPGAGWHRCRCCRDPVQAARQCRRPVGRHRRAQRPRQCACGATLAPGLVGLHACAMQWRSMPDLSSSTGPSLLEVARANRAEQFRRNGNSLKLLPSAGSRHGPFNGMIHGIRPVATGAESGPDSDRSLPLFLSEFGALGPKRDFPASVVGVGLGRHAVTLSVRTAILPGASLREGGAKMAPGQPGPVLFRAECALSTWQAWRTTWHRQVFLAAFRRTLGFDRDSGGGTTRRQAFGKRFARHLVLLHLEHLRCACQKIAKGTATRLFHRRPRPEGRGLEGKSPESPC